MKTKSLAGWFLSIALTFVALQTNAETILFATNKVAALTFREFTVGSNTFTNVTIGSRTPTDVFLRHQYGLLNVKVDELSHEQLIQLGYESPDKESAVKKATTEAKSKVQEKVHDVVARTIDAAEGNEKILAFAQHIKEKFGGPRGPLLSGPGGEASTEASGGPSAPPSLAVIMNSLPKSVTVVISVVIVALPILYFFICYTAKMVCTKAGTQPGPLIWIPFLSMIPLFRAAKLPLWLLGPILLGWTPSILIPQILGSSMATGWILLALSVILGGLNLVIMVVWCVRITEARGKGRLAALALIFPFTAPFAWLYLAYSE